MADDEAGSNSMPARVSTGAWLPNGGLNGVSHTTATQDTVYAPDAWLPHVAAPSTVNANCDRVDGSLASPSTPRQSTPSLRFLPLVEQTPKGHPPLVFNPIYRTLPHPNHVIRIGRYSERDNTADQNSPTAQRGGSVGFKSKVVSRRHCEMFQSGSHWFLKDVKSSSGTFLNHVRLSPPGVESRPFPVQDGDQIQLGIDFRGGEEMIFRCVKIRMELNRGWQRSLNNFNTTAHKRLQDFRKQNRFQSDAGSTHSTECSICLNAVAPCQTLFVAPCSHTWHYKCIKPMIDESYPNFLCPNCRGLADLEADVDEPFAEEWQEDEDEIPQPDRIAPKESTEVRTNGQSEGTHEAPWLPNRAAGLLVETGNSATQSADGSPGQPNVGISPITAAVEARNRINMTNGSGRTTIRSRRQDSADQLPSALGELIIQDTSPTNRSKPVTVDRTPSFRNQERSTPVARAFANGENLLSPARSPNLTGTPSTAVPPDVEGQASDDQALQDLVEAGPITPRNDVGPFVLDGSTDRSEIRRREREINLDAVVAEGIGGDSKERRGEEGAGGL